MALVITDASGIFGGVGKLLPGLWGFGGLERGGYEMCPWVLWPHEQDCTAWSPDTHVLLQVQVRKSPIFMSYFSLDQKF